MIKDQGSFVMQTRKTVVLALGGLALATAGGLMARFHLGRQRADRAWAGAKYPKLRDAGTVKQCTILPLIDLRAARDDLVGEPGVSYLVRADDTTILFDVGYNTRSEHPSPLLRNMMALGVDLGEIDYVFISHLHCDHVGGTEYERMGTFALSGQPLDLEGRSAFVPEPMTHPTAFIEVVRGPRVIVPGVTSIGPIPRQLFFLGWTLEQSLAVNVAGKGVVLIIGCGHSTIQHIVERAEMLFDEPIYGIVGGLHYPATASREMKYGLPLQRIVATGKYPWDMINPDDVQNSIAYLQRRHPQLVALSPHDSCDWTIEAFRRAFAGAYRDVLVGEKIVV